MAAGGVSSAGNELQVNPIRKVVSLLQGMAKNVGAEGEKEKHLFDRFMCYCKGGEADLQKSISDNGAKYPVVQSDLEQAQSSVAKLKEDLKEHRANWQSAKQAIGAANAVRAREHKMFQLEVAEKQEYLTSLSKAMPTLQSGMAGTRFLQTNAALMQNVRKAASVDPQLTDDDRESVMSFLSMHHKSADEYAPSASEVIGILTRMKADYEQDLADITARETTAVGLYKDLIAAKTKESKSLGYTVQKKTARAGELAVDIVNMKHDLKSAEAMLNADSQLLKNLKSECATKTREQAEREQMRSKEMLAIHDTISILNADDSLDLFKQTLSPSGSLLQVTGQVQGLSSMLARLEKNPHATGDRPEVRFLEMALQGKRVDFSKVAKLVDDMMSLLDREQADDDNKKEFCKDKMHAVELKAKELVKSIKDHQADLGDRSETLSQNEEETQALRSKVTALDRINADATEQRRAQNQDFTALMSSNTNAKELLEMARARLQKFYNPAKKVALARKASTVATALPAWAGVDLASGDDYFTGVSRQSLFKFLDKRPAGVAAFFQQKYQQSTQDNNNVVSMLNQLVWELETEMKLAGKDEERDQTAYQDFMKDSAAKRTAYLKGINDMLATKAENEELKAKQDGELIADVKEHKAALAYKAQLHSQCDWLLQNVDLRRTARADEMDQLKKAKATLIGADYSLAQAKPAPLLSRGRHA